MRPADKMTGKELKYMWNIAAVQVRYHVGGTFYMPVTKFPAALCDPDGYVVFRDEWAYRHTRGVSVGARINVPGGVSGLPGYVRMR